MNIDALTRIKVLDVFLRKCYIIIFNIVTYTKIDNIIEPNKTSIITCRLTKNRGNIRNVSSLKTLWFSIYTNQTLIET